MPPLCSFDRAGGADVEWCARVMASSEPWLTLRRDLPACREALARPGTEVHVARAGGQTVGFALVAPYGFAGAPYLASIGVAEEYRSRGIGSELLDYVETLFGARRHLFLLVSSFNTRAQQLYHRRGYRRVGELPDYLVAGASEFVLHKRLP